MVTYLHRKEQCEVNGRGIPDPVDEGSVFLLNGWVTLLYLLCNVLCILAIIRRRRKSVHLVFLLTLQI